MTMQPNCEASKDYSLLLHHTLLKHVISFDIQIMNISRKSSK